VEDVEIIMSDESIIEYVNSGEMNVKEI